MPGVFQPITVSKSAQRIQYALVPSAGFLLVNTDLVNNIYVGNDPGSQVIPVPPLGSVALTTAGHDLWVSTNGGNYSVQALLLPGGSQWSPSPAQIAAQIQALGLATASNQATQITGQTTQTTTTAALGGSSGRVAEDMLHSGAGVTTEFGAILASGSPTGTAGGVPLLRFTNQLGSGQNQNLPITTPQTLVNGSAINQPGYEMWLAFWFPVNSGTVPFATLQFQWADSTSGDNIKTQNFVLTAGNAQGNALNYYLNGPCYGDQLFITMTNLDPAIAGTYDFVINQTSHVFTTDKIVQSKYATGAAPFGFTNPNGTPGLGVIATVVAAVAAAASVDRLIAVYSGKAFITIDNLGGANVCRVRLLDPSGGNIYGSGSANQSFFSDNVPASSAIGQEIALPRGPVMLEVHNSGASGSITPAVTITAEDY